MVFFYGTDLELYEKLMASRRYLFVTGISSNLIACVMAVSTLRTISPTQMFYTLSEPLVKLIQGTMEVMEVLPAMLSYLNDQGGDEELDPQNQLDDLEDYSDFDF